MTNELRFSRPLVVVCLITLFVTPVFLTPDPAAAQNVSQIQRDEEDASDVQAIMSQSRRFSEAYVRGDIESLVEIYRPDGVAAPAGRDFIRGRDDLLQLWKLPAGRTVVRHQATPVEIEVDGDHAYDWGYYEGQVEKDGELMPAFRGTYMIVWERGDDDVWRIAMDMWAGL